MPHFRAIGTKGEGAISTPNFGRSRSKTFSFKQPWINTRPSPRFSDSPMAQRFIYFDESFDLRLFWKYLLRAFLRFLSQTTIGIWSRSAVIKKYIYISIIYKYLISFPQPWKWINDCGCTPFKKKQLEFSSKNLFTLS